MFHLPSSRPWPLLGIVLLIGSLGCTKRGDDKAAMEILSTYEKEVVPLEIDFNRASWDANVSGSEKDFAVAEKKKLELDDALSRADRFARLKELKEKGGASPAVARQLELLYLSSLERQVPKELLVAMAEKETAVEKSFNTFRAKVGGRELSDSDVRKTLKESKDSAQRRKVWEASKQVGAGVEKDLRELVRLRNETARQLGFSDYHAMQLALDEQDQKKVLALFDELDRLTAPPFQAAKAKIDAALAKKFAIKTEELRPWHYDDPFFQEAPALAGADLDTPYRKADPVELSRRYFAGLGLPVDAVLSKSDLFEKKGKSPHAFCTDIDRRGDVRVLANVVANEYWTGTMLHELGHAVYSSLYMPTSLPYIFRTEAHTLTTEAIAMLFGKFSKSARWLKEMGVPVTDYAAFEKAGQETRRNELLVFSRWCQVMLRFEMALYANPSQDLNKLWWDLVERYQGLKRPEGRNAPDYAAKIHVVSAPAYYHNYLMGEMYASQLQHRIGKEVLRSSTPAEETFVGKREVGDYLKDKVFSMGRSLSWDKLIEHSTGQPLSAEAFARDFRE